MLDFIFTVDYEIYGNGSGSLDELVYKPAKRLIDLFSVYDSNLVFFIEAAELEMMESVGSDPAIDLVLFQIKEIRKLGHEIGLHIHPQWYKGRFQNGQWILNYDEYNLCLLPEERISEIIRRAISFLRDKLDDPSFIPLAYRGGNWLMTPSDIISRILYNEGVRIDSSVFKGGYQYSTGLDYRRAPADLFYWRFSNDVLTPDSHGPMLELPVFTKMIPLWKFMRGKRLALEKSSASTDSFLNKIKRRFRDFMRWKVPVKLDYCRLSYNELLYITKEIIRADRDKPDEYRPIVLIGHTKDNPDNSIIEHYLAFLKCQELRITTFGPVFEQIVKGK
ncbi:MAG: hypothetical protein QME85_08645 [Candidatus Saccharicenans sp.]|nr:hypothetical protein [Candidatus Saccharicenans sp.]MDI6848906.1 hypothetical protein [Candidatus Saccharicenans sp.]